MKKATTHNRNANSVINDFLESVIEDISPTRKEDLREALVEAILEDYSDFPENLKIMTMHDLYEIVDSYIDMNEYLLNPEEDD